MDKIEVQASNNDMYSFILSVLAILESAFFL